MTASRITPGLARILATLTEDRCPSSLPDRIVVLRNYAPLPPIGTKQPTLSSAGARALIVSNSGQPEWFVRFGWISDPVFNRELRVLASLERRRPYTSGVPETRFSTYQEIGIGCTRFSNAATLSSLVAKMNPAQWCSHATSALCTAERLLAGLHSDKEWLAHEGMSEYLFPTLDVEIPRHASSSFSLDELATISDVVNTLRRSSIRLQHGDFWSANVLFFKTGDCLVLDWADCGVVWAPLYDAFHLLLTGPIITKCHQWFATDQRQYDPWAEAHLRVLSAAAQRAQLSHFEVCSALIYYLARLYAYRLRPGVAAEFSAPVERELRRCLAFVKNHELAALLPKDLLHKSI